MALVSNTFGLFCHKSAMLEMKSVEFNERTHTLNFCIDCQIYRPIRSYHCNNCGVCIEEMGKKFDWRYNGIT